MEEQKEPDSTVVFKKVKLHEAVAEGSLDFEEWTSLISETEKIYPDNIEKICLVYDSFLSEYPLCYGYWRKYINHKIRLCTIHKVVEAFERAVVSATYSVEVWADYCNFARMVFEDPSDVHRLFKRAISFVGKDYLCHTLWDKYIEFAFSLKHWSSLADIYIQALRFPTKKLHRYYNSFKKLVEIWEDEMESHSKSNMTTSVEPVLDNEVSICYKEDDISCIIKDLLDPSIGSARRKALQKYMSIGEHFYQQASQLNEKINHFETRIKRSYFHVKPVDISQLENWHQYLDFAESHGDFDWAVKLYERCLIPCANYPEFWIRYTEFMESKGGREIAHYALDRATTIFLKRVSVIHLFNARFKEHVGDVFNARAAFLQCDTESDSDFVENVVMRSNMEKRHGNFEAASTIYKEAIEKAATKEKWHILPTLYVNFSQLKYMTSDSEEAARDILIDGIKQLPSCKLLIEELIKFGITHGRSRHVNVIHTIVANAISPGPDVSQGFSPTEREQISRLYLEFVDLCGTILDVRKAWNQHIRLFPESVRASSFCPAMGTKQWKITLEAEEETLVSMPHQPSGDTGSQCLIQSSVQDKKLSPLKNYDTQDAIAADQVSDQKLPLQANHDMLSKEVSHQDVLLLGNCDDLSENNPENVFQAKVDLLQLGELDNNVHESVHIASPKVSEPIGTDVLEPNLSLDFKNQVANVTESTPASLEFSEDNNVRKEHGNEPEPDLKLPSLEGLSLNIRDAKSPGPISPTACDSGATDRTILLDGNVLKSDAPKNIMEKENISESGQNAVDHIISSPVSTQATASAQTNTGHVSPTFSASNQKSMADTHLQPQKLANNGKNWHQRSGSDRFHRDSKFGFRGHSHKRMHKQLQSSPQRLHPRAEKDMIRDHPSQPQFSQNLQVQQGGQLQSQNPASAVQTNQTAPQAWQMNNLQQQNLSHTFQFQPLVHPTTNPQLQMSQHPIQSNEQQGNVQNNQAYDQMWQYYYYQQQQQQQQQLLWQQQQMLQHQQPQQQQMLQHQQPQQQQMLQHQQSQQQQLLQQQYQQQLLQMQYFQQQQLQMQQQQPHQMQQQQPYQQQHLLYLQQQQQLQLQQPQHQQSLQQQKHHLQQQTASSQQHPHEQEQGQPVRQTNTLQVQEPDTDTIDSSASPRPVSPKLMT